MNSLFCILALGMALEAMGADESSVPLMPKDLRTDDRGSAAMLPYKDGVMLKNYFPRLNRANKWVATYQVYAVSFGAPTPALPAITGLDKLLNAGLSGGQCVVLGLSGKEIKAVALGNDGSWNGLELPRVFTDEARTDEDSLPVVIPSRSSVALMMNDLLCWREGDAWRTARLPAVPKFCEEFEPSGFGEIQYLDGTRFYAGWDEGEWGGMLAMADVAFPIPAWGHVSGKDGQEERGFLTTILCTPS